MLRALEADPHGARLRCLLGRFRAQEETMSSVLRDLQAELEHWHREAVFLRTVSPAAATSLLRRCSDLQAECDQLAVELVHVRMAVSGTGEELADHEGRFHRAGVARRSAATA